ncbi:MAG: sensor histidine kinase [Fervidobacterium sp.]
MGKDLNRVFGFLRNVKEESKKSSELEQVQESKDSKKREEKRKKIRELHYLLLQTLNAIFLILLFAAISNNYMNSWQADLERVFESFRESLIYPAWTLNKNLINMILNTMINKTALLSIEVYDDKGELLGNVQKTENLTLIHSIFGLRTRFKEYKMDYKGFYCGRVIFEYSLFEPTKFLFTLSFVFILLYFVIFLLIKNARKNEKLGELVNELNDVNTELELTLSELEETQQKIINSEKMAALGKLMVNIAHDVNTPTGVIYSSLTDLEEKLNHILENLNKDELTEEELREGIEVSLELIKIMLRNAQRIKELVQSLKRVAINEITETYATVNMKDVVNDVLNAMNPKLRKTKIDIKIDVPDGLIIHTVPGAWAQILMNLIDNAIIHAFEYDNPGEINVKIEKVNGKILLSFSDNGKGMNEETKRRAFEPFYTTDQVSGTGLGLSIVYQVVVDLLKGDIYLESEEGKGTSFKIVVPTADTDESAQENEKKENKEK